VLSYALPFGEAIMTGLEEIAQILGGEFQSIAGAPITFITLVLVIGTALGVALGFFVWELRGSAARSRLDRLRERKTAEDDLLEIVREKHEHEVEVREEIEADFERLHSIVDKLHSGHTTTDELITDATAATETAVEELKQAHEEFLRRMQAWDEERFHKQHTDAVSGYPRENTPRRIRSSGGAGG
jgi:hypothetical protein